MTGDGAPGYPEPRPSGTRRRRCWARWSGSGPRSAWKCADLDEAGLRATLPPSTVTLGGLLKHLAYMEDVNFTRDLAGRELPEPWRSADWEADEDWEWHSAADDSPRSSTRCGRRRSPGPGGR